MTMIPEGAAFGADIKIVPLPAFQDNYIWLLRFKDQAIVVDPGDARPVIEYLSRRKLNLHTILITHHHGDHIGGVSYLTDVFPDVQLIASSHSNIKNISRTVQQGDVILFPEFDDFTLEVLEIPGHTLDHIAFYDSKYHHLFCGDTLFGAGCGRVFEGTYAQMFDSLNQLVALPEETQVYPAHEYTLSNLRFANAVDITNPAVAARVLLEQERVNVGHPTLPTTLKIEKDTNPFLRCTDPDIVTMASDYMGTSLTTPLAVFSALREWKNIF